MFHSQSQKPEPKKQETSWQGGAALIGGLLLLLGGNRLAVRAERFYFEHFETIYLLAYLALAAVFAAAVRALIRSTRRLAARVRLLEPVWSPNGGIYAGATTVGGVPIFIPAKARLGHVQILGSTGRGKTESVILPWLMRDLQNGHSAILIDGKGDPELVDKIKVAVRMLEKLPRVVVFDLGNAQNSCTTNPLGSGSAQQITDRLFTAFDFEDPFYRGVQYRDAGNLVALIQEVDAKANKPGEITFRRLHELLTNRTALTQAVSQSKNAGLKERLTRLLSQPDKDREHNLMGLISQIEPFATGEVASLVNGPVPERQYQSISEVVLKCNGPTVFAILLPTLKYQQMGRQLGKLLLQELAWAVGERASHRGANASFLPVYLDEFSAFVYKGFENVLSKARSSQVALHLSHQSIGDLAIVDSELGKIINTNTNVKCLLGLNDPDTADFFAKHIGTGTEEKLTERAKAAALFRRKKKTGDVSIREVEAYKVHPNRLKNYANGRGVLHFPSPRGNITEEIQFERLYIEELTA